MYVINNKVSTIRVDEDRIDTQKKTVSRIINRPQRCDKCVSETISVYFLVEKYPNKVTALAEHLPEVS